MKSLLILLMSIVAVDTSAREWRFTALLDGKEIGYQNFKLEDDGGLRIVTVEAEFNVRFLFFNAYRYSHRNHEIWRDDCLWNIHAHTDDNGERYAIEGRQENGEFVMERNGTQQSLSGCVMTFAYWDPRILEQCRLLNSQTGEYQAVDISLVGPDFVDRSRGPVPARRYRLKAEGMRVDVWYAENGDWLQLESIVRDGSVFALRPKGE